MEMLIAVGLLIFGFVILIKGADFLVEGASAIAKRFGISDIIIGLTIVSFGTSAPELVVNVNAVFTPPDPVTGKDVGGAMVLGNVLGSNIYNLCLILGVAGLIHPLVVQRDTLFKELPLSFVAVVLVFIVGNDVMLWGSTENMVDRVAGIILLGLFIAFLGYVYLSAKKGNGDLGEEAIEQMTSMKSSIYIILGIAGLIGGGKLVVDNAVFIATVIGMSERVVALTVVAIGTSLPELATSAVAAMKKNSDIAVGNVVGSNIFNILLVLGASASIKPFAFDTASNMDIYVVAGATILLALFLVTGSKGKGGAFKMDRWQAGLLLIAAISYTTYLVVSNYATS